MLRLTTRRLMVFVAILALAFGVAAWLHRRSRRFAELDRFHLERWLVYMGQGAGVPGSDERAAYHSRLSAKYARASERPWWPVEEDPPELE